CRRCLSSRKPHSFCAPAAGFFSAPLSADRRGTCTRLRIHKIWKYVTIRMVIWMTLKETIVERLVDLCAERHIVLNTLATRSGVTPSTVYSLFDNTRQDVSVSTIKKLCDGLEITLGQFFSTKEFDELEQEIK
ncbi:MAG: helix-turn-helix domain-containing protein, partial [Candidatus Fimenecus sp.]